MKTYRIHMTLADGSVADWYGIYSDGFAAVIDVIDTFPDARRISARRITV